MIKPDSQTIIVLEGGSISDSNVNPPFARIVERRAEEATREDVLARSLFDISDLVLRKAKHITTFPVAIGCPLLRLPETYHDDLMQYVSKGTLSGKGIAFPECLRCSVAPLCPSSTVAPICMGKKD